MGESPQIKRLNEKLEQQYLLEPMKTTIVLLGAGPKKKKKGVDGIM